MNLIVFVVNLESRPDRWALMQSSANEIGLELNRIEAVDGRSIQPDDWVNFDKAAFEKRTGRHVLPGEYGCYRSHIAALESFINSDAAYGVILEDDIVIDAGMMDRIRAIVEEVPSLELVKLINHRSVGFISLTATSQGDEVGRTLFGPQGSAAAYLVSREGARKLVQALTTMTLPWDVALEAYWQHGVGTLSLADDVAGFSERSSESSIAPEGYRGKLPVWRRMPTGLFRASQHLCRFHHAALGPERMAGDPSALARGWEVDRRVSLAASIGVLVMLSALWVETDAYRYAGIALVVAALIFFFSRDLWRYDKPLIGYAGLACIAWAFFVAARFGFDAVYNPERGTGSAEGIYLFPLLYPTVGYAIWRFCVRPFPIVVVFTLVSLGVLAVFTDYGSMFINSSSVTLTHNNPIHASVAAGIILICAISFTVYAAAHATLARLEKALLVALGIGLAAFAVVNVLILNSKGVWLAMAVTLPVLLVALFRSRAGLNIATSRMRLAIIMVALIVCGFAITVFADRLVTNGGEAARMAKSLVVDVVSGQGLMKTMEAAVASPETPTTVRERLALWLDALSIWSESPVFGAGIGWRSDWENRVHSGHTTYNLLHNGFLELGMRYGLVGLAFYGGLFAWAVRKVFQAARRELIAPEAASCYLAVLVFFLMTNLSNSNIRLAIGESMMWLLVSFGFYCSYRLQGVFLKRPRTWF